MQKFYQIVPESLRFRTILQKKSIRPIFSVIIMSMLMISLSSCFRPMFKTNTTSEVQATTLAQLIAAKKFFILHSPDGPFALDSLFIEKDTLRGRTAIVWGIHREYLNPDLDRSNFYHIHDGTELLNEVHIYASSNPDSNYHLNLPINQIVRIDIYEKDKAATTGARIGSSVAIAAGMTVLVILLKAAMEAAFEPYLH
jgi:hypothetical protein